MLLAVLLLLLLLAGRRSEMRVGRVIAGDCTCRASASTRSTNTSRDAGSSASRPRTRNGRIFLVYVRVLVEGIGLSRVCSRRGVWLLLLVARRGTRRRRGEALLASRRLLGKGSLLRGSLLLCASVVGWREVGVGGLVDGLLLLLVGVRRATWGRRRVVGLSCLSRHDGRLIGVARHLGGDSVVGLLVWK